LYYGVLEYLQHAGQPSLTAKAEAEAEAEAELEPLVTVFAFEGSKRVPTTADLATQPHVHSPCGSALPMGSGTEPAQQVGSAQPAYNRVRCDGISREHCCKRRFTHSATELVIVQPMVWPISGLTWAGSGSMD
jgi:hypothetical protein